MTITLESNYMNPAVGSHLRASVLSNQDGTPSTITLRLPSNSVSTQATASGDTTPPTSRPPTPKIKKNVKHRNWLASVKWNARVVHIALTVTATISAILFSVALSWKYVLRDVNYSIPLVGDPLRKVCFMSVATLADCLRRSALSPII